MSRFCHIALLLFTGMFLALAAGAQSDEVPLGDLARNLRKNQAPPRTVIDNDNLSDVMEQGENRRWASSTSRLSSEHGAMEFVNPPSPDVTCALSFTAQRDLLGPNLHPENLPNSEIGKLEGPATIVGDSLQLSIHNGSNWDLREITVGFTVVHRQEPTYQEIDGFRLVPAVLNNPMAAEKQREMTVVYHMKGTAAPAATTLFQAPLNLTIAPDHDWHWAIIQAKGIPPANAPEPRRNQPLIMQAPN